MQDQATTTPLKPTRASFIRSLPESMPVEEVIERGREIGIVIQPSDIHSARYYMRQGSGGAPTGKAGLAPPDVARGASSLAAADKRDTGAGKETLRAVSTPTQTSFFTTRTIDANDNTVKERKGRAATADKAVRVKQTGSAEEQLRLAVLRVGVTRARAFVDKLEAAWPIDDDFEL